MSSYDRIATSFHTRINTIAGAVDAMAPGIERGAAMLVQAALDDRKVLVCGAGPDGDLAAHTASRLREGDDGVPALPALAIATGQGASLPNLFDRDLRALSRDGDVLICIDTSEEGRVAAYSLEVARARNLGLVLLSRFGDSDAQAEITLLADSSILCSELALMALNCLDHEIQHLLLGE